MTGALTWKFCAAWKKSARSECFSSTERKPSTLPPRPYVRNKRRDGQIQARRGRSERGSVSIWVVIFTFVTLVLLVLVVDGGQTMNAKSRAADIAEQAARAAADDLNVGDLRTAAGDLGGVNLGGGACDLQNGPAATLVTEYADGIPGATAKLTDCTQSVQEIGGTPSLTVTATVRLSVRPDLPVPPFTTISATAQETAYLACGTDTQQEAC